MGFARKQFLLLNCWVAVCEAGGRRRSISAVHAATAWLEALVPESGRQGWQRPCGHFGVCDVGVRCGQQTV